MKLKSFVLSASFSSIIFLGMGNSAFAAGSDDFDLENITINKDHNYISLDWEDIDKSETYIIKHEDSVIYNGDASEFKHEDLEDGGMYEYHLMAFDDDDVLVDNIYLKLYTPIDDELSTEIGVDTIVSNKETVLTWPAEENSEGYSITRNDKFVGDAEDGAFFDDDLFEDSSYDYSMTTEVRMSDEEIAERIEYLESLRGADGIDVDDSIRELLEHPYEIVQISTYVDTLPDLSNQKVTLETFDNFFTTSSLPSNSYIRINTMILNSTRYADGYVKAPVPDLDLKFSYYGTDNRTSISSTGSFRTRLQANIRWSDRNVTQTKDVGATKRYRKSDGKYTYKDQKFGSLTNVYLGKTRSTTSMVDINFKHKSKNPYHSSSPNIEYEFRSEIYRDGTTKMKGYHTLFPSLGIFRSDGSGYRSLYTHNQGERSVWTLYSHKTIDITKK